MNPIMKEEKRSPKTLTEIKQNKIFKQIILTHTTTHAPSYHASPFCILLKSSYINERYSTALDIEIEKKNLNVGNITSIMGYYPRNG